MFISVSMNWANVSPLLRDGVPSSVLAGSACLPSWTEMNGPGDSLSLKCSFLFQRRILFSSVNAQAWGNVVLFHKDFFYTPLISRDWCPALRWYMSAGPSGRCSCVCLTWLWVPQEQRSSLYHVSISPASGTLKLSWKMIVSDLHFWGDSTGSDVEEGLVGKRLAARRSLVSLPLKDDEVLQEVSSRERVAKPKWRQNHLTWVMS